MTATNIDDLRWLASEARKVAEQAASDGNAAADYLIGFADALDRAIEIIEGS